VRPGEGEPPMTDPVVDKIVVYLARVATGEVPETAREAAKIFIADTLGVGIAGAGAPWRREVHDMAASSGGVAEATVWGTGETPAAWRRPRWSTPTRSILRNSIACTRRGRASMAAILPSLLGWASAQGT